MGAAGWWLLCLGSLSCYWINANVDAEVDLSLDIEAASDIDVDVDVGVCICGCISRFGQEVSTWICRQLYVKVLIV